MRCVAVLLCGVAVLCGCAFCAVSVSVWLSVWLSVWSVCVSFLAVCGWLWLAGWLSVWPSVWLCGCGCAVLLYMLRVLVLWYGEVLLVSPRRRNNVGGGL